jgi:hypothetical protein
MALYNKMFRNHRGLRKISAILMTGVLLAGSLPAYADPESPEPACGLTEHVHTEACYTAVEPASLNCVSVDPHLQNIHKHTEHCFWLFFP